MRALISLSLTIVGLGLVTAACGGSGGKHPTATPAVTATVTQPTITASTEATSTSIPQIQPDNQPIATPLTTMPEVSGQPTVTSSGLQIYETRLGSGTEARIGSIVRISYAEWLSDGTKIDETTLGPVQQRIESGFVIPGWLEGIPGMKEGGQRRLVVPPALTQGDPAAPAGATIIYDIDLISIVQP